MPADYFTILVRVDKTPIGQHVRQYNVPMIKVTIVIVSEEFDSRDIILHCRNGDVRVSETY